MVMLTSMITKLSLIWISNINVTYKILMSQHIYAKGIIFN